ncbi:hypothetical protein M885DRAFT_536832 [Pelagophyceae sp. CCMP2097]|nr:hypothetical protein M885DRAFT_536832 [Pelagophyceae sp. CCMP2097]
MGWSLWCNCGARPDDGVAAAAPAPAAAPARRAPAAEVAASRSAGEAPSAAARAPAAAAKPLVEFVVEGEASPPSPRLAMPSAWCTVIQETTALDTSDAASQQGVDLEVWEGVDEKDDIDDAHIAAGPTFADAWRQFKEQEEVGFGMLRKYVSANYPALLRKVLSPDRENCGTDHLGPETFSFRGRTVRRSDYTVKNERGFEIKCSLWCNDLKTAGEQAPPSTTARGLQKGELVRCKRAVANQRQEWLVGTVAKASRSRVEVDFERHSAQFEPGDLERVARRTYCIVYVHDVGGSRLGSLSSLGVALDTGVAGFCAFDSTACGRSGGRFVSFGSYERYDVAAVCSELVRDHGFTDVVLWGRGAGAVAATLYTRLAAGRTAPATEAYWFQSNNYVSSPRAKGRAPSAFAAYAPARAFTFDLLDEYGDEAAAARKRPRGRAPTAADRRFGAVQTLLDGMALEPLTLLWVLSKPPLVVTRVDANSLAWRLGVRVADEVAGISGSLRLPHTAAELRDMLDYAASRPQSELTLHVRRGVSAPRAAPLDEACLLPLVKPAALILDCVIDSPQELVDGLRVHAVEREPVLVTLLEPLLGSAVDVLYHSVLKRANFDPSQLRLRDVAAGIPPDIPAMFALNDFFDLDRGVPSLEKATLVVYDAFPSERKQLVRYNAPLRLALRGTLDAMSSKFLNKCFVFIKDVISQPGDVEIGHSDPPRWVVTTRPWAHVESRQWLDTIDDYEAAQAKEE